MNPVIKPVKVKKKKRKKVKPLARMTRDTLALWSKAIRALWGGRCAMCGNAGSQAHHFFGKKAYPAVKFDLDNGVFLCFFCHIRKLHQQGDTEPAREQLLLKIGTRRFNALRKRAVSKGIKVTEEYLIKVASKLQQQ